MRKIYKPKSRKKAPAKTKAVKKSSALTKSNTRSALKKQAPPKKVASKPVKKAAAKHTPTPVKRSNQRKRTVTAKPQPKKKVAIKKQSASKPTKKVVVKKVAKQPIKKAIKKPAGKTKSNKPDKPIKAVKQAPKAKQQTSKATPQKAPAKGKKASAKQSKLPEKKTARKPSKNLGGYNKVSQIVSSFIRENKINLAEGGISFHEAAHNIYLYQKAQKISLKDLSNNIDIIFYQHSGYKSTINWPDNVPFYNADSYLKPQYLDSGYDIAVSADLPGEGTDTLQWFYRGSIEGMLDEFTGEPKKFCRKYYNASPVAYFKFISADRAQGVVFYELLADRGPVSSSEEAEKFGPPPSEEYGFDKEGTEQPTETPTGGATPPKKEEPKKTPPKAQPTVEETEKQIQLSKQRESELRAKEAADKSEIEKMQKRIELINMYKALFDQQLITLEEFKQMIKQ